VRVQIPPSAPNISFNIKHLPKYYVKLNREQTVNKSLKAALSNNDDCCTVQLIINISNRVVWRIKNYEIK